jgi:hypothetical protein
MGVMEEAVNFYAEHFDIRRAVLPQVLSVRQVAELSENGPTMNPTFFGLLAEFSESEIPPGTGLYEIIRPLPSKSEAPRLPSATPDSGVSGRISKITLAH